MGWPGLTHLNIRAVTTITCGRSDVSPRMLSNIVVRFIFTKFIHVYIITYINMYMYTFKSSRKLVSLSYKTSSLVSEAPLHQNFYL